MASKPFYGHGLTKTEREIMEAWDSGLSIQRIVEATQHPFERVQHCVSLYHGGAEKSGRTEDLIRRGSAMLAARIAAVHGAIA